MNVKASDTVLYRNTKCCEKYGASSSTSIKKVCHANCNSSMPTSYKTKDDTVLKRSLNLNRADTIIHCPDHGQQFPIRTKCYQYKNLLQRIRSLLGEIKAIRKNEATGMCEFCRRYNTTGKCKRCEILAKRQGRRYEESVYRDEEARQQRYKIWLSKVKQFLYVFLEREVCQHKLYHDQSSGADELTILLNELKSPLHAREPCIRYFPSMDSLSNLTESKDILEEVLLKLKTEKHYDRAVCTVRGMPCPSTCKYFSGKNFEDHSEGEDDKFYVEAKTIADSKARTYGKAQDLKGKKLAKDDAKSKSDIKTKDYAKIKDISIGKSQKKLEKDKLDSGSGKESKKGTKEASKTGLGKPFGKRNSNAEEEALMAMMLKSNSARKEPTQKIPKPVKLPSLPKIGELPMPKRKEPKIVVKGVSESIIECGLHNIEPTEMVKGMKIVLIEQRTHSDTGSLKPILFKVNPDFNTEDYHHIASSSHLTSTKTDKMKKSDNNPELDNKPSKGVIKYSLSNRDFIDKGWTLLPTTRIMRRMNIYKMLPANPEYDWFKRHQSKRLIMYDSGEKFAEMDQNGNGRWFYKNGLLAMDYYSSQEINSGHRYVIYSSGEKDACGRKQPLTVLASFDYLGNGVVYDHFGNERLKYNQTEGVVVDRKIAPPGRWKWHSLNEPPVLQPVFTDTRVKPDSCFQKLFLTQKDDNNLDAGKREPNLEMLTIELENFMKEKASKLLQEYKPYEIKMKALKINDQFSLKVLDQSNIHVMFRDGQMTAKLNLGMLLISDEIIDTDSSEVSHVSTPYDRFPPKSQSVADIQNFLKNARKFGKNISRLRE